MVLFLRCLSIGLALVFSTVVGCGMTAEERAGERLFRETRFGEFFAARSRGDVNARMADRDRALDGLAVDGRTPAISCRICHLTSAAGSGLPGGSLLPARGPIPTREGDGEHRVTPRNSPSLIGAVSADNSALLHFDGEFATAENLVVGTFFGRNFGWLPTEQLAARKHFVRVIREDDGKGELAREYGGLAYAVVLRGTGDSIPTELRLPVSGRFDPAAASGDEIIAGCARLVAVFLRSLQFSRDAEGLPNGTAYDSFLEANRLPRGPRGGESRVEYSRRLREHVVALRAPRFVDASRAHGAFGEAELRGMRIFFREGVGPTQSGGAGNCAECHVPPQFSDFAFHNTGATQEEYDVAHGAGAFLRLLIPDLSARSAAHDRWLPPTFQHPQATGPFVSPVSARQPDRADLGLWNVYANPDFPAPQPAIERLLNPTGQMKPDEVLAKSIARFKTSTVRGLRGTEPFLHNGAAQSLEDVVRAYQRASVLARQGKLRNPPPEFFGMRIADEDVGALVAFLQALNESRTSPQQP